MRKMIRWLLVPVCILGGGWYAAAQFMPPMMGSGGGGQDFQAKFLEELKKKSPELYQYEKQLHDLQKEVQAVTKSFADGEIDHDTAKSRLTPLLKSEKQIRDNPDYQVEQKLFMASSMKAFQPKGMPPRRPNK